MSTRQAQKLVDEIRSCVNSPDQTNNAATEELARQYAEWCRLTNERLTRCGDFLERGLRTQAIHLAESEPDLLEIVSILHFAELDEWQELAASYALERFQPLKLGVAQSVNSSYEIEGKLQHLGKSHRKLALSRAPVRDRLRVMREIAAIDVGTAFWMDDIREFEKYRIAELLEMADQARKGGNTKLLRQLIDEYEAEKWKYEVPQTLLGQYHSLLVYYYETRTIPNLASEFVRAMQALDIQRLFSLRKAWDKAVTKLRTCVPSWNPSQQVRASVGPAFAYLEQQIQKQCHEDFEADLVLLEKALHENANQEQVKFFLAKAESHEYPLPPLVLAKLNEYWYSEKEARFLGNGVVVALVIAGITGIVFLYFMFRSR